MEILSIGEKIKRARIYKGLTLRDMCKDKISVSKMSCIENNKVSIDDSILEYIGEKLDLDIKYLTHDIKSQIQDNIETFKEHRNNNSYYKNYVEEVKYNLSFAEQYKYYDLCCELEHLLFSYYLYKRDFEKLRVIIPKYYDLCQNIQNEIFKLKYYMDIAVYLSSNNEYIQAISYYSGIRKRLKELDLEDKRYIIKVTYNECAAYIIVEDFENAEKVCEELKALIPFCEKDTIKGDIYYLCALLALHMNDEEKFNYYKEKSFICYKDDIKKIAISLQSFSKIISKNNNGREKAERLLRDAIDIYPKDNLEDSCVFLTSCIEDLIRFNLIELAQTITDEVLNYAITLDSIKFIESAYYYKAILLQMQNNYQSSETYMNLSLDSLVRYGTKDKIYKRYLEMGKMYHKLGETSESIKFFNLAMQLERKI